MGLVDWILIAVIAAAVLAAVSVCVRNHRSGKRCSCDCGSCSCGCDKK